MNNLETISVLGLPRVPNYDDKWEINQEYLHIPKQGLAPEGEHFSFILSLVKENNDLLLKSVTLVGKKLVSEKLLTYEDVHNRLTNHMPEIADSDGQVYHIFANSIFHYREERFAKQILLENNITYEQILAYRGFALYPTFNLKSLPKPFPVLRFNNNCHWEINLYYKMIKTSRYETPEVISLAKVSWDDEEGIRQLVKILLDESKYRELEIQALLSL